jgi:hypothetical protein
MDFFLLDKKYDSLFSYKMESCEDVTSFVCTKGQIMQLFHTVQQRPACQVVNFSRKGHVGELVLHDMWSNHQWLWASSPPMKDDYVLNYKLTQGFLCSGMLATQFVKFCNFVDIGNTSERFKRSVYPIFAIAVEQLTRDSMQHHIQEELKDTTVQQGIKIATDARHGCRKNSYHTDVIAIGHKTHRVVNYQHVTKEDERSSQKHEAVGTQRIYEHFERQGVPISSHAHDRNGAISKIVAQHPETQDSLDTWHASKEVRSAMTKVAKGALKRHGETWHTQLSDKIAGVKTHSYYCMRYCGGDPQRLRALLDNVVEHYQNRHQYCIPTSRCKIDNPYVPSRLLLTENKAIELLQKTIRGLFMYKHPEKYTACMDTHYVESFNNVVLVYTDKRVHLRNLMYTAKIHLAILDWNENVDRECTSLRQYRRAKNPRSQAPTRVLKPKTFTFVNRVWRTFQNLILNGNDVPIANEEDIAEEINLEEDDGDDSFVADNND